MVTEGSKVVYAGADLTIEQGTVGRVLFVAGSAAHVQWQDGPRVGQVDLIDQYDLSPTSSAASVAQVVASQFDQSLEMEDASSGVVREAMDSYGEDGVLVALAEKGHLATLEVYATEALSHLTSALRTDPALGEMLACLDADEQEAVLARLAATLLDPEQEAS